MQVLCIKEYWEHGTKLRKAGAVWDMTPELFELYEIFVKKIEPKPKPKRVEKPVQKPVENRRGNSIR